MISKPTKTKIKEAAIKIAAIKNQPVPDINIGKLKIFIMKPTTVLLFIFCCVAHFSGIAQSSNRYIAKTNEDKWKSTWGRTDKDIAAAYTTPIYTADSCYEYVDSISVEYGFRSTNVRYKLLVRDAASKEKFVMTLYSDYNNLPGPAPVPKGLLCIYRGIITVNKRAYKVDSIK